jgi:hypothetical protein
VPVPLCLRNKSRRPFTDQACNLCTMAVMLLMEAKCTWEFLFAIFQKVEPYDTNNTVSSCMEWPDYFQEDSRSLSSLRAICIGCESNDNYPVGMFAEYVLVPNVIWTRERTFVRYSQSLLLISNVLTLGTSCVYPV